MVRRQGPPAHPVFPAAWVADRADGHVGAGPAAIGVKQAVSSPGGDSRRLGCWPRAARPGRWWPGLPLGARVGAEGQ